MDPPCGDAARFNFFSVAVRLTGCQFYQSELRPKHHNRASGSSTSTPRQSYSSMPAFSHVNAHRACAQAHKAESMMRAVEQPQVSAEPMRPSH
eukprot:6474137-Amphidinium_carterae.2